MKQMLKWFNPVNLPLGIYFKEITRDMGRDLCIRMVGWAVT